MKSPYLNLREVAQLERIHPETAYKRAQAGKIPGAKKIGKEWRINAAVYAEAVASRMSKLPTR